MPVGVPGGSSDLSAGTGISPLGTGLVGVGVVLALMSLATLVARRRRA